MAHAPTLQHPFIAEHRTVLRVSVIAHAGVALLLALNINLLPPRQAQPVRLAIQAQVVNDKALRQQAQASEARRREDLRADIRRRQEEIRAAEASKAERQQAEERRRDEAKQATQAAATKRQQDADARRVNENRKAEQQRTAAETRRKAEAARRAAQTEAELARQLAEEEELLAAADSGLLDQYAEIIRQKVERNWIRPASAREGLNCIVLVKQIPGGEVVEVRVTECNGDAAVLRSIEAAVLRASPLPPPPDRSLFERSLRFNFRPRD